MSRGLSLGLIRFGWQKIFQQIQILLPPILEVHLDEIPRQRARYFILPKSELLPGLHVRDVNGTIWQDIVFQRFDGFFHHRFIEYPANRFGELKGGHFSIATSCQRRGQSVACKMEAVRGAHLQISISDKRSLGLCSERQVRAKVDLLPFQVCQRFVRRQSDAGGRNFSDALQLLKSIKSELPQLQEVADS